MTHPSRSVLQITLPVSLLILLPEIVAPLSHDNELYQSMGWLLAAFGRLPYIGAWDQNFPGIIYIHSAIISVFGVSPFAFRAVDFAVHLFVAVLIAIVVHRYYDRRTAIFASTLYALDYMYGGYWLAGQRDGFASPLIFIATLLYLDVHRRVGRPALSQSLICVAGLLMGFAIDIRPTHVLMAASLGACIWIYEREHRWRLMGWYVLGVIGGVALMLLPYLTHVGAMHEFYLAVVRFNLDVYASVKYRGSFLLLLTRPREIVYDLVLIAWIVQYVMANGWPRGGEIFARIRNARVEVLLFAMYYVASRLSVLIMGKYFIHHYELAMVLTAILASRVIGSFFSSMPNPAIARAICLPVLLALVMRLYAVSMVPTFVSNVFAGKRVSPRDLHLARSEKPDDWELQCDQITDYLERQGVRGGAIEVWGWAPGLYWRTGTHPSSRFMMMIPLVMKGPYMRLRDYQLAWQREYLDSLRSDPPKFIVIAKDTMGLHTFYDQRADVLIDIIPGFRALLDSAYRLDTAMRIWDVYKKNRTRD